MTNMTALLERLDSIDSLPDAIALRERGYELLRPEPGHAVVDVGCGSGRAVHELSRRGVQAHGVDPSDVMIEAARNRWPGMDFRLAPAERLPFGDGELDGYRTDKVLHVLESPQAAIDEARRVLRPGGRAVLVGQDWDLIAIDADDPDLTRRLVRTRAAGMSSPNIARGYSNMLRDNGFTDLTVEVHMMRPTVDAVLGAVLGSLGQAADEAVPGASDWIAEQRDRAANGRFFAVMPMFLAAGTR
ncbi:MAG: methyltransferase domain-containing protein [Stackebrandtia sp.]